MDFLAHRSVGFVTCQKCTRVHQKLRINHGHSHAHTHLSRSAVRGAPPAAAAAATEQQHNKSLGHAGCGLISLEGLSPCVHAHKWRSWLCLLFIANDVQISLIMGADVAKSCCPKDPGLLRLRSND